MLINYATIFQFKYSSTFNKDMKTLFSDVLEFREDKLADSQATKNKKKMLREKLPKLCFYFQKPYIFQFISFDLSLECFLFYFMCSYQYLQCCNFVSIIFA